MKLFDVKKVLMVILAGTVAFGNIAMGMDSKEVKAARAQQHKALVRFKYLENRIAQMQEIAALHGKSFDEVKALHAKKKSLSRRILSWCWDHKKLIVGVIVIGAITYYVVVPVVASMLASSAASTDIQVHPDSLELSKCSGLLHDAQAVSSRALEDLGMTRSALADMGKELGKITGDLGKCTSRLALLEPRANHAEKNLELVQADVAACANQLEKFWGTKNVSWSWLSPKTWLPWYRAKTNCDIACDMYFE